MFYLFIYFLKIYIAVRLTKQVTLGNIQQMCFIVGP